MKKILVLLVITLISSLIACGSSIPTLKDLSDFKIVITNAEAKEATITLYEGSTAELVIPNQFKNEKEIFNIVEISKEAFKNNQTLKQVTIPNTIKKMSEGAFENCRQLETVIFETGTSIETIPYKCFYSCVSLTNIQLPTGVKYLYNAFTGCEKLKEIALPEGLEEIYGGAFSNCTSLESISFPSTLKLIYKKAFTTCSSLKTVNFNGTKAQWEEITVYLDGNEVLFHIDINFVQ